MESGASRQAMHTLASLERHVHRRNWGLDGTIGGEVGMMQLANASSTLMLGFATGQMVLAGTLEFSGSLGRTSMKNISATTATGFVKACQS